MNLLPNFAKAYVDLNKLTEYCLNLYHPSGKNKAIVFKAALDVTAADGKVLMQEILNQLGNHEAITGDTDEYGTRYSVRMQIRIFNKEATVQTGWIILKGEDFPRLVTCYIKK